MGFINSNVGRLMGSTSTALTGAQALLAGETDGLAFDFTDSSAYIIDTGTPANNYSSTGIVSSGALVGPSGKLTYTSPSNKLTLQSDGFIKYQAHNLYLNSAAPANQSITVVSGASYAVTITGTVSVTASGAATGTWTAGTNTFTAATTTLTLGSTSGSGTVHVRRTPSNDDYIETAGAAKYALPLEYDTSGNCLGLLVEEERTNLVTYATTYENAAWVDNVAGTGSTPAITDNAATAPDGTTTAATITLDLNGGTGSGDISGIYHAVSGLTAATVYTGSTFVKGTAGQKIGFRHVGAASYTVHTFSGEWERITTTETSIGTSSSLDILLRGNIPGISDTVTFYIWVSQLELGAFPTSPIITYGAAATRAADNISIATSAFPYSTTAETIYCEFDAISYVAGGAFAWVLDGPLGDHDLLLTNSAMTARMGATGSAVVLSSPSGGTFYKTAVACAANDLGGCVDGGTVETDATAAYQDATGRSFYLGNRTGTVNLNGHIKAISYVPRRKTDAELQAETT